MATRTEFTPPKRHHEKTTTFIAAAALAACAAAFHARAQTAVAHAVRAEADTYMTGLSEAAGVGKLRNLRDLASIDNQRVIRMNRDTLGAWKFPEAQPVNGGAS